MIPLETIRHLPKVLLHDHLDGGLRPGTLVELAADAGYRGLPTNDAGELARWFTRPASTRSLEAYLAPFEHTIAVMQDKDAIARVAAECAEDLAADGVVYAEVRHAAEVSTRNGVRIDEVIAAILEGFRIGSTGRAITIRYIVSAMRTGDRSLEAAHAAVRHRDEGVVGFDLAGAEEGYPPSLHLEALRYLASENLPVTIHAGESAGLPSIQEALHVCGADRLGHGVRIVDDITLGDGEPRLGRLASYVRDRRVPLELCPSSNVHTGAVTSLQEHPIDRLRELRFRVTVNTDNRLMSGVTLSSEFAALARTFDLDLDDVRWLTINAMKSAFAPFDERMKLIGAIDVAYDRDHATGAIPALVDAAAAVPGAIVDAATAVPGAIAGAAATIAGAAGAAAGSVAKPIVRGVESVASGARRGYGTSGTARRRRLEARARKPLPLLYDVHPEARRAGIRDLGVRTVLVSQIRGTAVEGPALRRGDFLPIKEARTRDWESRWQRIRRAIDDLVVLPPLDLYQFGDGYWVIDGHNRVAAALYNDQAAVDAAVVELRVPGMRAAQRGDVAAALAGSEDLRAAGSGRLTRTVVDRRDPRTARSVTRSSQAGDRGTTTADARQDADREVADARPAARGPGDASGDR